MNMKLMRLVVVLIAIVCLMSILTACGGKDDHHDCTFGADVISKVGTSAECTKTTRTCTVCGEKEVVSNAAHKYQVSDPQVVYDGDVAKGYQQIHTCEVCKYSYARWLKDAEISDANLPSIEELNAKHVWTQTESETTKAEYDAHLAKEGKTDDVPVDTGYIAKYYKITRSCSHCNETEVLVERRDSIDPNYKPVVNPEDPSTTEPTIPDDNTGDKECKHEYQSKVTAPTCTAKGYTQYTCSKCQKSYTSDYTNAKGHKWSTWKTVDPTCTKDGSKSRSCANCDKSEKETLKATGHKYGSWSTTKAATCSAAGSKERKCSTCGDVQKESIAALSHTYGSWTTTKQATCGAAGSKERKCSACGKTETQSIAALSHKYGSWSTTKAATCDTNGTKSRKCSGCGKTETQSIAATGHEWDSGKVTTQATSCSAMGIKTFTCKNCGKTRTEQIKGNHTFGDWKYEEYTYKEDGVDCPSHRKVRSCTKCGYKEYGNTPDHYCARGSDNHKVTTVKEGTCSTKATMRSTCKICGWYVEYEGKKGKCNLVEKNVHLSDYGTYTNELDATVSECTSCGAKDVTYSYGKGFSDYNRYRNTVIISQGTAFASRSPSGDDFLKHPTWQTVIRDHKYDSDGYVKQFTVYWHDASGNRYSYVVDCTPAHLKSWFAEYGLEGGDGYKYQLKISGSKIVPYKISWTG